MEEGNVARFQSMINLFLWSGESDKIDIVYLSSKITEFLVYMNIIDSQEMQKFMKYMQRLIVKSSHLRKKWRL